MRDEHGWGYEPLSENRKPSKDEEKACKAQASHRLDALAASEGMAA